VSDGRGQGSGHDSLFDRGEDRAEHARIRRRRKAAYTKPTSATDSGPKHTGRRKRDALDVDLAVVPPRGLGGEAHEAALEVVAARARVAARAVVVGEEVADVGPLDFVLEQVELVEEQDLGRDVSGRRNEQRREE
jgi:hypothetical protein